MTVDDLYATFASTLSAHARRLTGDKDQADDLFQETFIRAMTHLELLGSMSTYQRRAWLYRTMGNLFIDRMRARRRELFFLNTWLQLMKEEMISNAAGWQAGPVEQPGAMLSMTEIMKQIPEKHRDLVYMRFILGLTSAEIAKRIGIPASTVRFRLHVEIKKLRERVSRFA